MLNQHNFARLRLNEKNSFRIIPTREVRYEAVPMKENLNEIPKNHDHYMYTTKIKHVNAEDIGRNFRPFMTKYGRLMEIRKGNKIIISDTGINIHRLAKLITQLDKPLSKEEKKKIEEEEERHYEIRKLKAKNCSDSKITARDLE